LNGFLQELENPLRRFGPDVRQGSLGYLCFWTVREEMQLLDLAVHPAHRAEDTESSPDEKLIMLYQKDLPNLAGSESLQFISQKAL